ncbi:MAG: hypothetical protein ACFE95_22205 [Candidatus Hodarchaeota archaeon]
MVGIEGIQDTVNDLVDDLVTLVLEVLLEDVFFEIVWNRLAVFIFVTMSSTWGFMLMLTLITYGIYRKYVM